VFSVTSNQGAVKMRITFFTSGENNRSSQEPFIISGKDIQVQFSLAAKQHFTFQIVCKIIQICSWSLLTWKVLE